MKDLGCSKKENIDFFIEYSLGLITIIDFLIFWVNGNDREWRKKYNKYKKKEGGDTREVRFRDWANLQYWFRGVEKFAPWVDKIHFITWGHLPSWLRYKSSKFEYV